LITTSLWTVCPADLRPSANRAACRQVLSISSAIPERPSERIAAQI
jgi:hypothetical protein